MCSVHGTYAPVSKWVADPAQPRARRSYGVAGPNCPATGVRGFGRSIMVAQGARSAIV